jgi:hypothetical protein
MFKHHMLSETDDWCAHRISRKDSRRHGAAKGVFATGADFDTVSFGPKPALAKVESSKKKGGAAASKIKRVGNSASKRAKPIVSEHVVEAVIEVPTSPFVLDTSNAFAALAGMGSPSPASPSKVEPAMQKPAVEPKPEPAGIMGTPIARRTRRAVQDIAKAVGVVIAAVSPVVATRQSGLRAMSAAQVN